ncbi:GNAT family N-acetyltransferase [Limibaculum sp. M0105]|uniref:GNAT family N-acetyltransferase n=1 Tax=Thermohalobaculum xanthum TaxID=2753746 RepID=A0A8J7M520_9RHOB|nr:GNAT family N-acetyltransferase [Thermohalobaculum xanthum]MBK0398305.1 GNAT family N-acetyltransferase [Thermohalobaculum xanthum]
MTQPILRQMSRDELATVVDWAAAEGWNPGLDDVVPFYETDPEGFFVAEVDGRIAAAISVVNHTPGFAFLGLYICHPEFRGQGIGFALWNHALDHAGTRTVGLDGVPDQQENYERSGFVRAGETLRYAGVIEGRPHPAVRPAQSSELPALAALEAAASGVEKERFFTGWLADTAARKTLVLDRGEGPRGFATLRECRDGFKVGPLVAENPEDAFDLLHAVAALTEGAPVMVDVPSGNEALGDYCRELGLEVPFSTARMYKGPAPATGRHLRAVATLELG